MYRGAKITTSIIGRHRVLFVRTRSVPVGYVYVHYSTVVTRKHRHTHTYMYVIYVGRVRVFNYAAVIFIPPVAVYSRCTANLSYWRISKNGAAAKSVNGFLATDIARFYTRTFGADSASFNTARVEYWWRSNVSGTRSSKSPSRTVGRRPKFDRREIRAFSDGVDAKPKTVQKTVRYVPTSDRLFINLTIIARRYDDCGARTQIRRNATRCCQRYTSPAPEL